MFNQFYIPGLAPYSDKTVRGFLIRNYYCNTSLFLNPSLLLGMPTFKPKNSILLVTYVQLIKHLLL